MGPIILHCLASRRLQCLIGGSRLVGGPTRGQGTFLSCFTWADTHALYVTVVLRCVQFLRGLLSRQPCERLLSSSKRRLLHEGPVTLLGTVAFHHHHHHHHHIGVFKVFKHCKDNCRCHCSTFNMVFSARCNIYISRLCYDVPSVCPSVCL